MRDTYNHLGDDHTLTAYIARQSLVSAASNPTTLLGTGKLASAFQNRSLDGDIGSTLFPQVRRHSPGVDVFLIDLLSDRLGVFALPDGSYVTASKELRISGRLEILERRPSLVAFGTARHFSLWKKAAGRLIAHIDAASARPRTLVIETPWASHTESGELVPTFRGLSAAHANELYAPYYGYLRDAGLSSRRLPDEFVASSLTHKWGPAPYHYSLPAYEWMKDEILSFIG